MFLLPYLTRKYCKLTQQKMGYGPINVSNLPSKYISEDFPYPIEGNSCGVGKKRVYGRTIIYISGFFGEILPLGDKRKGLQIYEDFFRGKWHKFTKIWGKKTKKKKQAKFIISIP
jgi:hypothetical protein